jgi:hypothetical protein
MTTTFKIPPSHLQARWDKLIAKNKLRWLIEAKSLPLEVRQPWLAKFEVAARELSSLLVNGLITDRQTHAFALGQQEERRLADAMTKEEYDKWEGPTAKQEAKIAAKLRQVYSMNPEEAMANDDLFINLHELTNALQIPLSSCCYSPLPPSWYFDWVDEELREESLAKRKAMAKKTQLS